MVHNNVLLFFQHNCASSLHHWPWDRALSHGLCSLIVNQWAMGIMGLADESEPAQSKHDPPTEPIITDPVHSLLKD
jgi:hypothetical protein